MISFKDVVKKERAKEQVKAPAAGGPALEEIKKEILKNHKALIKCAAKETRAKEAIEAKAAKESAAKSDLIEQETKPIKESGLEVFTVEPPKNPNEICPFCLEEKSARGMNRHIAAKHKVPGVTVQDLDDIEKGLKSLKDLTCEKFPSEDEAEVYNLAPEVEKKHFSDWMDVAPEEEGPEDPEEGLEEDPEQIPEDDRENPDNPGPPGDPSCYDNPGDPELKKNRVDRRKFNWIPFFSPFNRRSYRK